jgi:hypothetical protein
MIVVEVLRVFDITYGAAAARGRRHSSHADVVPCRGTADAGLPPTGGGPAAAAGPHSPARHTAAETDN